MENTQTLYIGSQPDPQDRLQIEVSNQDFALIPPRGPQTYATTAVVTDIKTGKRLMLRRATCGLPECNCALELMGEV